MSNRQIRRDAWGLFRANYLGILAGVAVVEGIVCSSIWRLRS